MKSQLFKTFQLYRSLLTEKLFKLKVYGYLKEV